MCRREPSSRIRVASASELHCEIKRKKEGQKWVSAVSKHPPTLDILLSYSFIFKAAKQIFHTQHKFYTTQYHTNHETQYEKHINYHSPSAAPLRGRQTLQRLRWPAPEGPCILKGHKQRDIKLPTVSDFCNEDILMWRCMQLNATTAQQKLFCCESNNLQASLVYKSCNKAIPTTSRINSPMTLSHKCSNWSISSRPAKPSWIHGKAICKVRERVSKTEQCQSFEWQSCTTLK